MNNSLYRKYIVSIKLKSPLHINSGDGRSGYRSVITEHNEPIIPASTIKGKMRDNFARLTGNCPSSSVGQGKHCYCPVCSIFGARGFQPSRIYVQDFRFDKDSQKEQPKADLSIRMGTAVDRYRRVAEDEALYKAQVVENKYEKKDDKQIVDAVFTGNIEVYFTPDTIKYEKDLRLALKMIETIGGGKSRGFGFVEVEVKSLV